MCANISETLDWTRSCCWSHIILQICQIQLLSVQIPLPSWHSLQWLSASKKEFATRYLQWVCRAASDTKVVILKWLLIGCCTPSHIPLWSPRYHLRLFSSSEQILYLFASEWATLSGEALRHLRWLCMYNLFQSIDPFLAMSEAQPSVHTWSQHPVMGRWGVVCRNVLRNLSSQLHLDIPQTNKQLQCFLSINKSARIATDFLQALAHSLFLTMEQQNWRWSLSRSFVRFVDSICSICSIRQQVKYWWQGHFMGLTWFKSQELYPAGWQFTMRSINLEGPQPIGWPHWTGLCCKKIQATQFDC